MTRGGAAVAVISILAMAVASAPLASQQSADPFYLNLLRDGQQELERGDARSAARDLRLACFGLLDLPPQLGACLVHLGLAQAALEDREGFHATFTRILEVEERFEGYSKAVLPEKVRSDFEDRVAAWIAPSMLENAPRFAGIAERRAAAELLRLPEKERFRELEKRAAAEPKEPRWALLLAELELARDRPERARERLTGLPDNAGGGQVACLRAEALARSGNCAEALSAYASCPEPAASSRPVAPRLGCLFELSRLDEASTLLAGLSPVAAREAEVAKLRRELERRLAERARTPISTPAPVKSPVAPRTAPPAPPLADPTRPTSGAAVGRPLPTATPPPPQGTPRAPAVVPPAAADLQRLAAAREALGKAARITDLESVLATASGIADRYPLYAPAQELAGEAAYRASNWKETVKYLDRAGLSPEVRPELVFYLAVAKIETGDREGAQRTLRPALPRLVRSPFLDSYVKRILGEQKR